MVYVKVIWRGEYCDDGRKFLGGCFPMHRVSMTMGESEEKLDEKKDGKRAPSILCFMPPDDT